MRIYNSFVSEYYKKLQQGHSSIFLVGESHPRRKKFKKFDIGKIRQIKLNIQRTLFCVRFVTIRNTY